MDAHDLAGLPLFEDLSPKQRARIAQLADVVEVKEGYHLLEEGAFPHEFYVILEGTVSIGKGGEHLTDLGRGDFFGEIAMLEDADRRTATCVAATPVAVAVMGDREFRAMRSEMPEIADRLEAAARARLES